MNDKTVEIIRGLMRPFLTILFPTSLVLFIFLGYLKDVIPFEYGVGTLLTLTTAIMTHHFTKSQPLDSTLTPKNKEQ